MLRWGRRQRDIVIEKAPDMANALAVSTLVGQFLTDRPDSILLAVVGSVAWIMLWIITFVVSMDDEP